MNRKEEIAKKVEDTLESFSGVQQVEPAPFFYTRVRSRLEKSRNDIWERIGFFLTKPVIAVSAIMLVILLNLYVVFNHKTVQFNNTALIEQSQEEDYNAAVSVSLNYENQGQ